MSAIHMRLFLSLFLLLVNAQQPPSPDQQQPHHKFEYKHSFKGPNLAQKDGTIPFWEISGDAIASAEQLRLAPSIRSKQGAAWNTKPMAEAEFWQVDLSFKITGQGRIGADGLGFWYTANKGIHGPVFGSNDHWNGLGLFFDSFDNDAQRNNPYVLAMVNDGTKAFDHNSDGMNQQLAGCQKDFRNRPFPVKARIIYFQNVFTVLLHDGMTQHERYEMCLRAENVVLPKNGYFGVSAATGGLADDHDVLSFLVTSLKTQDQVVKEQIAKLPEQERKEMEEAYQKHMAEFEAEKEKFRKEHPDKAKKDDMDYSKLYEDAMERELRMIYEGQSGIHRSLRSLEDMLNRIVDTQSQHTTQLNGVYAKQSGAPPPVPGTPAPGGGQAAGAASAIERHEVNELLQLIRDSHAALRDMKTYTADVHSRIISMESKVLQGSANAGIGSAQPAGSTYEYQTIKAHLEGIKHDVEQVRINQRGTSNLCPSVDSSCLTVTLFLIVAAAQSVMFLMYFMLKGSGEKAKFY